MNKFEILEEQVEFDEELAEMNFMKNDEFTNDPELDMEDEKDGN